MSFAAGAVAYYYERITKKLVEHFKENNALSTKTAIEPNISSIADSLRLSEKEVDLHLHRGRKFFKRIEGTNKWYLDELSYSKIKDIEKICLLLLAAGVIALIIYTLLSLRNLGVF